MTICAASALRPKWPNSKRLRDLTPVGSAVLIVATTPFSLLQPKLFLLTLGFLVALVVIALPLHATLVIVILARVFSDYGVYHPNDPTSAAQSDGKASSIIGIVVIVVAIVRTIGTATSIARRLLLWFLTYIATWTVVGYSAFGWQRPLLLESVRLAAIICVYLIAAASKRSAHRTAQALLWCMVPPGVLIIAAFAFRLSGMVDATGRAFGSFSHPNSAVAYFSVATLLSIAFVWYDTNSSRTHVALAVLGAASAAVTESLAGLAGLAVGLVVLGWTGAKRFSGRIRGLAVVVTAALLAVAFVPGLSARLLDLRTTESITAASTGNTTNSLDWRFYNWNLMIAAWRHHPLFGYGLGATESYIQPGNNLAHSVAIQLLVETGVIGTSLAVFTLWRLWTNIERFAGLHPTPISTAAPAILSAAVVESLASNMLGYSAAMFELAAILGLYSAERTRASHHAEARAQTIRQSEHIIK